MQHHANVYTCMMIHTQGKYQAPGGGPPEARLNRYKRRYAEAESR